MIYTGYRHEKIYFDKENQNKAKMVSNNVVNINRHSDRLYKKVMYMSFTCTMNVRT